jgi:hypothetical protein
MVFTLNAATLRLHSYISELNEDINSRVGRVTGNWLDSRGSILGRDKKVFFPQFPDRLRGPPCLLILWVLDIKRPGREADHSRPSGIEGKNCGALPPLPHASSWITA